MKRKKFSLEELSFVLPTLDEIQQRGIIGGYSLNDYLGLVESGRWLGGDVEGLGYVGMNDNVTWSSYGYGIVGSGTYDAPYSSYTFDNWYGYWPGGYVYGLGYVDADNAYAYGYGYGYGYGQDGSNSGYSSQFLQNARQYEGTKYLLGGVSKDGMDCSGLITLAYNLPNRWTTSQPLPSSMFTTIDASHSSINSFISSLREGDVLVWKGQHAAIFVNGNSIYHAHKSGVNQTSDLARYWLKYKGYPTVYRPK
ncbi:MAG: NlpC/P60 family protein [Prevotella sp.]|nr:NlpC/P60 family protein [Prevotella sp.]